MISENGKSCNYAMTENGEADILFVFLTVHERLLVIKRMY